MSRNHSGPPRWVAVNQSHSREFQSLLERLAGEFGAGALLTGSPYPTEQAGLKLVKGPAYRRTSLRTRALSWFRSSLFVFFYLLFCRRPRLLFLTTNPPFLPHLGRWVGRLRRIPYILLFFDLYPDHPVQLGWLSSTGWAAGAWRRANGKAMRQAGAVVAIGEGMAAQLQKQATGANVAVVPLWTDTDFLKPLPKEENPFAREHGQVGRITVMYSGNIGKTHGVETLVKAAALLSDLEPVSFLVVGDGLGLPEARREAAELGVRNLSFLPFQPWETLPFSLAAGDIAVVLQSPGTESLSVPSKTYNFLAAGSAVVACTAPDSDLARLVGERGVGLVVPPGDAGALAEAIRRLAGDKRMLAAMRTAARQTAESRYSLPAAVASFGNLFRRCLP